MSNAHNVFVVLYVLIRELANLLKSRDAKSQVFGLHHDGWTTKSGYNHGGVWVTVLLNKPVDDEWIRLIVAAKQMGLTIAEVRNYVIECLKSANAGEGRQSEIES